MSHVGKPGMLAALHSSAWLSTPRGELVGTPNEFKSEGKAINVQMSAEFVEEFARFDYWTQVFSGWFQLRVVLAWQIYVWIEGCF